MKMKLLLPFLFFGLPLLGQERQLSTSITLLPASADTCCVYQVSIKNITDSIVCILHSMFIDLASSQPKGLPVNDQKLGKVRYSLDQSFRDTLLDAASFPYRGELILPYQSLTFRILLPKVDADRTNLFDFKYIYLKDIQYRQFMREMQKLTSWYRKYEIFEQTLELPSKAKGAL